MTVEAGEVRSVGIIGSRRSEKRGSKEGEVWKVSGKVVKVRGKHVKGSTRNERRGSREVRVSMKRD